MSEIERLRVYEDEFHRRLKRHSEAVTESINAELREKYGENAPKIVFEGTHDVQDFEDFMGYGTLEEEVRTWFARMFGVSLPSRSGGTDEPTNERGLR